MIYIGNTKIGSLKIGDDAIATGMIGTDKVFSSVPLLPTGYTQLAYVSTVASGGYVDTGITPSDTLGFKTRFKMQTVNPRDNAIVGARETTGNTRYLLAIYNGTASFAWLSFPSGSNRISISANTWYDATMNYNNSRTFTINNTTKSISGTQGTFTKTIVLLGHNRAGTMASAESSFGRTTFTLGTGDNIIADMIPCKAPNDEVGFYDIVREQFYGSANETALIAGPEVT